MKKRKWQDGEFHTDTLVIQPMRAPRQNVRVASDDMRAALSKAQRLVNEGADKEQIARALAELRGTINFCRYRWGLDATHMASVASNTQMQLETKYPPIPVKPKNIEEWRRLAARLADRRLRGARD